MISDVPDQVPGKAVRVRPTVAVPEIDGAWRFDGATAVWVSVACLETLGETELSVAVILTWWAVVELVIFAV